MFVFFNIIKYKQLSIKFSDFVEDSFLVGVTWEIPMAVLRATWQRGLPATSPWKLEIIGCRYWQNRIRPISH